MQPYPAFLFFGPPGSGKGTQGETLGHLPGFFHCSSGDVFRNLDKESELGKTFLSYSTKGELVPDELTIQIWQDHMEKQVASGAFNPDSDLLILDGLPRTVEQAQILDDKVQTLKVVYLAASDEQAMIDRLKNRAISSGRPDDADEDVIRNRQRVYKQQTQPVLDHYDSNLIAEVDALGTPAEVLRNVLDVVIPIQNARG